MIVVANQLVTARAAEEFRQASERILALIKKWAKDYRKNPSLKRALRLNSAIGWAEHIHHLCDCSCSNCWQQGGRLLTVVARLELGETPEVEATVCQVRVHP